jgi:hypothetical protein
MPEFDPSTRRRLLGVLLYYVVMATVVAVLMRHVPLIHDVVAGVRLQELQDTYRDQLTGSNAPPVGVPVAQTPWSGAVMGTLSMLGALAIMLPVTWIYVITRSRRGYDESVVHTLLILPVTVTGIVMIVQNSLALAFSLAGIVAAVRFRTTLKDNKDAVYVFLGMGAGLASGVQALGLALVLTLVFNGIILVLWWTQFGNVYADLGTGPGGLRLGDALAGPGTAFDARQVGDPAILDTLAPGDLGEVADRSVRFERYISEERRKKKRKRANALLLVHAAESGPAQTLTEGLLDELANRWKLAEIVPDDGGDGFVLEYLARLDGPGVQGAVLDRLHQADGHVIRGAELRSLKGLKKRK